MITLVVIHRCNRLRGGLRRRNVQPMRMRQARLDQGMQRQFGALQVPGLESISDGGESLLAVGAEKWIRTVEWTLLAQIDHRPGKPAEHWPCLDSRLLPWPRWCSG